MSCGFTDPVGCVTGLLGDAAGAAAGSIFDSMAQWFGDAATAMLQAFAGAFDSIPSLDLTQKGFQQVYAMSLGVGAILAGVMVMLQVMRMLWTRDGAPLARAFAGLGRAFLAFTLTLTVGATLMAASDDLTHWIITQSAGDQAAFGRKLGALMAIAPQSAMAIMMLVALISILVIVVLWAELIMRNAALAVLIATSPVAAAGPGEWWTKLVRSSLQLIFLKPVIAVVFTLGFAMGGNSTGLTQSITGLCILALAVISWPAMARFMPFTADGAMGGGAAALLGMAGGLADSMAGGGGPVGGAGLDRAQVESTAGASAQKIGGVLGAGPAGAMAAAGSIAGPIAMGFKTAQAGAKALTGLADQMAGHAGIGPGGGPSVPSPGGRGRSGARPFAGSGGGPDRQPAPAAEGGSGSSTQAIALDDEDPLAVTQELPVLAAEQDEVTPGDESAPQDASAQEDEEGTS